MVCILETALQREGRVLQYKTFNHPILIAQGVLSFPLFPAHIDKIRIMIPAMRLFQKAPESLAKSYTQGVKQSHKPINPVSHSCHIQYRPLPSKMLFWSTHYILFKIPINMTLMLKARGHGDGSPGSLLTKVARGTVLLAQRGLAPHKNRFT